MPKAGRNRLMMENANLDDVAKKVNNILNKLLLGKTKARDAKGTTRIDWGEKEKEGWGETKEGVGGSFRRRENKKRLRKTRNGFKKGGQ